MNLILVGFMGTGKSTVARELSRRLGWPVCELDERIARTAGKSIPEIFAESGEEGFRQLETQVLTQALSGSDQIISGGGGIVLREENRRQMKERGRVICLTASAETVHARVNGGAGRPNLSGRSSVEGIAALMESRKAAYEAAQDISINTDRRGVAEIAEEILSLLF